MNTKLERSILISLISIIFILVILVTSSVSAYTQSYVQGPNFIPTTGERPFPLFDREMCGAGQDFILQISPLGCTPSVVRSDLLEKQNVPVFCPVMATKINPLIDVEAVNRITFRIDEGSPHVQGVHHLPARAALGQYGAQVNQPIMNNIGYAVFVLRRQPNETAMPDFVEGRLTATIQYDIKNAFGVGNAVFYLPEMSDSEWENNFRQYSFWEGRGYLRAETITNTDAVISVYSGRETYGTGTTGKRILLSEKIDIGKTSREIPMPGFDYCLGSMELVLHGLESPDTRAKINVNGDVIELKKEEKFVDNKCTLTNVENKGIVESVSISCAVDRESGTRGSFTLGISPKILVGIEGVVGEYRVGDKLYEISDSEKSVYLGYIGLTDENKLFIVPVVSTARNSEQFKNTLVYRTLPTAINALSFDSGNIALNFLNIVTTGTLAGVTSFGDWVRSGNVPIGFIYEDRGPLGWPGSPEAGKASVFKIEGYADAFDLSLISEVKDFYEESVKEYQTVQQTFFQEKWPEDKESTLGEDALRGEIGINYYLNQKKTTLELCKKFEEIYPDSFLPRICEDAKKLSSSESDVQDVIINGKVYRITFEGSREPTLEEYSVEIIVDGAGANFSGPRVLRKNDRIYLSESEFISLTNLEQDYAVFDIRGVDQTIISGVTSVGTSERVNLNDFSVIGREKYQISVTKINLQKLAKVSVKPQVNFAKTEADFDFKIGIEKRLIQLSPEMTRDLIEFTGGALNTLKKINEPLGNLVSIGKAACLGVGGYLTVKNFFSDLGGRGAARQKVMRAPDVGWFDVCANEVRIGNYANIDSCLLDKNDEIESSINTYANAIEAQKNSINSLQEAYTVKGKGLFGEDILNYDALMENYVDEGYNSSLASSLSNAPESTIKIGNEDVSLYSIASGISPKTLTLTQAKNIELNSKLLSSDNRVVRETAWVQLKKDLGDVYVNSENERRRQTSSDLLNDLGFSGIRIESYESEGSIKGFYDGYKTPSSEIGDIPGDVDATSILYKGNVYILQLERVRDRYRVVNIYNTEKKSLGENTSIFKEIQEKFTFEFFDRTMYEGNRCTNCEVRYYETGQYKGLPAIVPFDIQNGWYAAVKSTLPIGGAIKPYDDSGRISSLWLCNVGSNKREEFFSGIGDDICQQINLGTGQPYNQFPGLEPREASAKVTQAVQAIEQASRAYRAGLDYVSIQGNRIKVGPPATGVPDIQCQDFMSPVDCNLLFNVCDPVVCPSSRCDLGGTYPVENVIQSGVIGSLALCLPNYPEVKIPICLSGVHAGLDAFSTILDSYQQCLQTSLDTGQTIGICDELHSIYLCEFFWRQGLPLAKFGVQQGLGTIMGQNARGGGEYLGVQSAWENAENSISFFTQYYADDSFRSFKARSAEGVGSEVCRAYVSVSGGGNILDTLLAPDSPSQYYGRFEEIPFTTATSPPISHYKVFYHIYAGKDFPAYYQVYLRSSGTSFFQDTSFRRVVANGFIAAGEYESQTFDFTAPAGYNELCINVNGLEECGFKQVTTDFFVNNITDSYLAQQASQKDITSERECVSGTVNILGLNPVGIEERADPAIYNRGITRICSTDNPGKGTDPERWSDVGYCGNQNVRCWLDKSTVETAIRNTNIQDQVLGDVSSNYTDSFLKEAGYITNFDGFVEDVLSEEDWLLRIKKINDNFGKVFFPNQIGYLHLLKGEFYGAIASLNMPPVAEGGAEVSVAPIREVTKETETRTRFENIKVGRYVTVPDTDYLVELLSLNASDDGKKVVANFRFYKRGSTSPLICEIPVEYYAETQIFYAETQISYILDVEMIGGGVSDYKECKEQSLSIKLIEYNPDTGMLDFYVNTDVKLEERGCEACGRGLLNLCDEAECGEIGLKIGKECVFKKGPWYSVGLANSCTEKISEEDIISTFPGKIRANIRSIQGVSNVLSLAVNQGIINSRCVNYAQDIFEASKNYSIPDPLLLSALMHQESGCSEAAISMDGSSIGIMQINPVHCGKYGLPSNLQECRNNLLKDAKLNIRVGAQILLEYYDAGPINYNCSAFQSENQNQPAVGPVRYTEWAAALRRYNGGSCSGYRTDGTEIFADQEFVEKVLNRFSQLISIRV